MNRFNDSPVPIDRVRLADLRAYLGRHGWRHANSRNGKRQIFSLERSGSTRLELVIPADERFADVKDRIEQAVAAIAQIEDRSIADVYADLVTTDADSLLIRLQVPGRASSVPLASVPRHVKAMRELILYSGCSERQPQAYFEKPLPKSNDLLAGFEFCHTFRGSFGFEISSIVMPSGHTPDLFEPPISRRIVERIARGLLLLEQSVQEEEPALLIEGYPSALNARMCDAIADIGLDGQINYDIGIDWASSVTPSEDVSLFRELSIGEPQVSMLKFVAEQLKVVTPKFDRIQGQVVNLHCTTNPVEGDAKRTIAVKIEHVKYGHIEVKIELGPESYLQAIDAHSKGQQLLASGQLQRKGNTWSLDAVTSVGVEDL